jgi:hypothetical protein
MRKAAIVGVLVVTIQATLFAQVLNTASVLRSGLFSVSFAPVWHVEHDNRLGLDIGAGVGIGHGADLAFKMMLENGGNNYFGGNVEFVLLQDVPVISLALGAHAYNDVGLDGTFNITFPIRQAVALYSGIDMDAEFHDGGQDFPLWVPVGLQVMLRRSLAIIMEIDIGAIEPADNRFALGMNVFF